MPQLVSAQQPRMSNIVLVPDFISRFHLMIEDNYKQHKVMSSQSNYDCYLEPFNSKQKTADFHKYCDNNEIPKMSKSSSNRQSGSMQA